jgi:hypothetical protein
MADSLAVAPNYASSLSEATQQAMQIAMLRQQAQSDQAVVALIQQSTEQLQALLPVGQGQKLDVSA